MFGFLIGTLSLIGLYRLYRGRGFFARRAGYGHGYGYRGGYGGGPRRWMLRRLFEHLDTTPGQEKVIAEVSEDVERKMWAVRDQFHTARSGYARAMRGEHYDGAAVGEALDAQQAAVDEVKKSVREGLSKIHEALQPGQRQALADLIEHGPRAMYGRGGGWGWGHGGHHGPRGWRHADRGGPSAQTVSL